MRIRGKLITGYFVVALLTAVVGYFGMGIVTIVNDDFKRQAEEELPLNHSLQELKYAGLRIVSSSVEYAFLQQQGEFGRLTDALTEEKELIETGVSNYRAAVKSYQAKLSKVRRGDVDRESVEKIRESGEELVETSAAIVRAIEKNSSSENLHELKHHNEEAEQQFLQVVEQQFQQNAKAFAERKEEVHDRIQGALRKIMTVTGATFALALLSGIIVSAQISKRLADLELAAQKIGNGELETIIEVDSNDEIGSLANTFSKMGQKLARTNKEVKAGKDFLNEIINSMMDALIVVAPDGTIQSINCEACTMLRYDDEPIGKHFNSIMPGTFLDELIGRGYVRDEEQTVLTKDGTPIPVAFSASVMWNPDNTVRGVVCVAQDITKRKQAEAELQRFNEELQTGNDELKHTEDRLQRYTQYLRESNDELKNFAYIISHDLRAPLVNIKGFAGELKSCLQELETVQAKVSCHMEGNDGARMREILETDVPEALGFINSSVTRMDTMINLVLKLSRLGHRELKPEVVDLKEMVDGMLKTLTHQLEQKDAEVTVNPLPQVVQDKVALEQIIGNLLDNAIKYLDHHRPGKLEIWVENKDGEYVFHFRDNGRGISLEDLNKVFEIFRRAGKQDVQGEGMGLAYVKALVRRLGGNIWCVSEFGVGSTFSFSLPMDGGGTAAS